MNHDSEDQEYGTGHDYDGIKENDYPLPAWWLATFAATIIFGFHYYLHYTFADGPSLMQEFQEQMKSYQAQVVEPTESEEQLKAIYAGKDKIAMGQTVFIQKCAVCHAQDGGGIIGPNLTDHFWIHGTGQRTDITSVIRKGVLEKGMPAWGTVLSDEELHGAAAFVYSLKGSHPQKPKDPEGQEVKSE